MKKISQTKLNIAGSVLLQIVSGICGLILPRFVLRQFGSEVNGLVASITQLLSYAVLLEGGMGGFSVEGHAPGNAGSHIVTGTDPQFPAGDGIVAMGADRLGDALHYAMFLHHLRAAGGAFLRRLEQQPHPAGQLAFVFLQVFCHRQQHCRMGIVTAGMHSTGVPGGIGHIHLLLHRQNRLLQRAGD